MGFAEAAKVSQRKQDAALDSPPLENHEDRFVEGAEKFFEDAEIQPPDFMMKGKRNEGAISMKKSATRKAKFGPAQHRPERIKAMKSTGADVQDRNTLP